MDLSIFHFSLSVRLAHKSIEALRNLTMRPTSPTNRDGAQACANIETGAERTADYAVCISPRKETYHGWLIRKQWVVLLHEGNRPGSILKASTLSSEDELKRFLLEQPPSVFDSHKWSIGNLSRGDSTNEELLEWNGGSGPIDYGVGFEIIRYVEDGSISKKACWMVGCNKTSSMTRLVDSLRQTLKELMLRKKASI